MLLDVARGTLPCDSFESSWLEWVTRVVPLVAAGCTCHPASGLSRRSARRAGACFRVWYSGRSDLLNSKTRVNIRIQTLLVRTFWTRFILLSELFCSRISDRLFYCCLHSSVRSCRTDFILYVRVTLFERKYICTACETIAVHVSVGCSNYTICL